MKGVVMRRISKRVFLSSRECLRRGWYLQHRSSTEPVSEADRFRLEQGQLIGTQAQLRHPDGVLVAERIPSEAATLTSELLIDDKVDALFEAAFMWNDCTTRADLLVRGDQGWIVDEVKSSLEDTKQLPDLIDDVTYTVMVTRGAGLEVERCRLLLISRDYRLGMSPQDLFATKEVSEEVASRLPEFTDSLTTIRTALEQDTPPSARLSSVCRKCEFFATECLGKDLQHPILHIPSLHKNVIAQLVELGIHEIKSVPEGYMLSALQSRVIACVKSGREYVGPTLRGDLAEIQWPAAYLDFETVATAIPLYPDVAPYQQITTQFSLHVCDEPGQVIDHHEYLADPTRDCQRELAMKLLEVLEGTKSVIVYHASFESGRLTDLAKLFQDLAPQLQDVIDRLFDLEVAIRNGYYHPDFRGSYSIKRVLPVLVPDLTYEGLPIGDGDTAVAQFARMALGQYDTEEVAVIRRQLLDYCALDTLAMVRLHQRLLEIV
jgi:predicted RecB family nuclease